MRRSRRRRRRILYSTGILTLLIAGTAGAWLVWSGQVRPGGGGGQPDSRLTAARLAGNAGRASGSAVDQPRGPEMSAPGDRLTGAAGPQEQTVAQRLAESVPVQRATEAEKAEPPSPGEMTDSAAALGLARDREAETPEADATGRGEGTTADDAAEESGTVAGHASLEPRIVAGRLLLAGAATRQVAPGDRRQRSSGGAGWSEESTLESLRRRLDAGRDLVQVRTELTALLRAAPPAAQPEVRELATRAAQATVFSPRLDLDDPLVAVYTVQPGDVLVNIGRRFDVPAEGIMRINGIRQARSIREGQKLKVPRGPFHATIHKSQFRLDLYLQDTYLASYPVGLGAGDSTPEGRWRVKERIANPTYYPSASATDKRIIPADDPENPLGEYWIGLEGIEGPAVGQESYGMHGTIDPDSIGRAVSLGCIRLRNEDIEVLFGLLQPGQSTVTIVP